MSLLAAAAVLVVSVDGLDQRYLDQPSLRIPNIRLLFREGRSATGVVGVVPTVTWPSHTTMISGVDAWDHGILSNRRPAEEGGDYYWDVSLLKRPTLLDAAARAGLKTGTITWPVTVNAPVAFNLPEYFRRRRGGAMDTESICSKAKPAGLCEQIKNRFPSFPQEWMDDRTRTLATRYFLQDLKADAVFVHLVDLDSEAHDNAPFTPATFAILEYTDELIGQMIAALPRGGHVVLVSDHGFEAATKTINLRFAAERDKVEGIVPMGGYVRAQNTRAAAWLKALSPEYGIGRFIPPEEISRFAKVWAGEQLFEAAPHIWFGPGNDVLTITSREAGNHGHWPTRYRAVYTEWGAGIRPGSLGEVSIRDHAGRIGKLMNLTFPVY